MTQQYDKTGYASPGGGYSDVAHRAQGHIGRYQQVKAEGQQLADQGRNRVTSAGQRVAQAAGGPSGAAGAAPAQAKSIVPPEQTQTKGQPTPEKTPAQPIQLPGQEQPAKRDPVAKAQSKKARKDTMKRQGAAVAKSPHTRNVVKGAVAGAMTGVKGGPRGMAAGAARGAAQSGVYSFRTAQSKSVSQPAAKRSLQQPAGGAKSIESTEKSRAVAKEQPVTGKAVSAEAEQSVQQEQPVKERTSKKASYGEKSGGALKGAASGALNGSVLGPPGIAVGAMVGSAHGRHTAKKTAKQEFTVQQQQKTAARQQAEADMENMLTSRGLNKEQQQSDTGMERG